MEGIKIESEVSIMGFGKMNTPIQIIQIKHSKDADGFDISEESVVASISAYREERHGSTQWTNRSAWTSASSLFRFRIIPDLSVTTAHQIACGNERFRITSVENVKGRNMYIEVLAEKQEPSGGV